MLQKLSYGIAASVLLETKGVINKIISLHVKVQVIAVVTEDTN